MIKCVFEHGVDLVSSEKELKLCIILWCYNCVDGGSQPYKSSFSMVGSRVRFSCSESLNVHMGHQEFNLAPRSLCVVWDQFTTWKRPL